MAKGEANRFGNGREINARLWVADNGIIFPPLTNIFWNVFIFPLSQSAKYLPIPQAEKSKLLEGGDRGAEFSLLGLSTKKVFEQHSISG